MSAKSMKKSPKRRKILRDNIIGITKNSIKRLAGRAGVKRISGLVYEEVRGNLTAFLQNVMDSTVNKMKSTKMTTIKVRHVEPSLDVSMYSSAIADAKCHLREKKAHREDARAHKFKPGTVALQEIKRFQKGGCLLMSRAGFARLVREFVQNGAANIRISQDALLLLQYASESHIVHMLTNANELAIHANRLSIQAKDLTVANKLTSKGLGPGQKVVLVGGSVPRINLSSSIKKVLLSVYPSNQLSSDAKSQVNFILNSLGTALANSATQFASLNNKVGISAAHVQSAVREILKGEMVTYAVSQGTKAVFKFMSFKSKKGVTVRAEKKAGLALQVSKARLFLKGCTKLQKVKNDKTGHSSLVKGGCNARVGTGAGVYLAAVLEYVAAEILELSGNSARDHKNVRITARDLQLAIQHDGELSNLSAVLNLDILGGGVLPNINTALLPKKSKL